MIKWDQAIICRVCSERKGGFLSLNSKIEYSRRSLLDVFLECTQLPASVGDDLPQMFCTNCVDALVFINKFLDLAKRSEANFTNRTELVDWEHNYSNEPGTETWQIERLETFSKKVEDGQRSLEYVKKVKYVPDQLEELSTIKGYSVEMIGTAVSESHTAEVKLELETEEAGMAIVNEVPDIETEVVIQKDDWLDAEEECESDPSAIQHIEEQTELPQSPTTKSNSRPYKCYPPCKKNYKSARELKRHQLTHLKLMECTLCGLRFPTNARLRDHLKMHSNERNYPCHVCDKRFNTRLHLRLHQASHSNTRPYVCELCNKSFQQRSVLKTHMTLHEGKNSECSVCKKKFSRQSFLNIHMRLHTGDRPYKCAECSKAYMQKSHLDRHMGLHLGIRFDCEHCGKSYSKKSTLDWHLKEQHLRDNIYTCLLCSKIFDKQKGYYYHMRKQHPTERKSILPN